MNKLLILGLVGSLSFGFGIYKAFNADKEPVVVPITTSASAVSTTTNTLSLVSSKNTKVKQLDLNNKQVVTIYGEIGAESYSLAKKITNLAKDGKPIYVLINSPGGSVLDGALIVSAIENSPVPVYTVCEELCASMGFIIHQFGTKRLMVDRAILMAHPAAGQVQGTLEQMKTRVDMIQRYVNKFNTKIAARAGLNLETYSAMVVSEMWLDAEDSTAQKFNDEVVNIRYNQVSAPIGILSEERKRNKLDIRW